MEPIQWKLPLRRGRPSSYTDTRKTSANRESTCVGFGVLAERGLASVLVSPRPDRARGWQVRPIEYLYGNYSMSRVSRAAHQNKVMPERTEPVMLLVNEQRVHGER